MMNLYVGKVCRGLAMCPVCGNLSRDEVEGLRKAMSFVAQATGGLVQNELACYTRFAPKSI